MPRLKRKPADVMDTEVRAAIAAGMERRAYTLRDMEQMLSISAPTYRRKKTAPSSFTVGELRLLIQKLELSAEQVCSMLGAK